MLAVAKAFHAEELVPVADAIPLPAVVLLAIATLSFLSRQTELPLHAKLFSHFAFIVLAVLALAHTGSALGAALQTDAVVLATPSTLAVAVHWPCRVAELHQGPTDRASACRLGRYEDPCTGLRWREEFRVTPGDQDFTVHRHCSWVQTCRGGE